MKNFEDKTVKVISKLTCDGCGEQASPSDSEFHEFISVSHKCGYDSIHGDGNQISIDLCQQCFSDMCDDSLTVTELNSEEHDDDEVLEYHNIFDAITQSKKEAKNLKNESDLQIAARDVLLANKISNEAELKVSLKRVEQLWDAQHHTAEGNELYQLAEIISSYERKSWDSYFNEVDAVSGDFMIEREDIKQKKL